MAGFRTTIDQLNGRGRGTLPGLIGIEFTGYERGRLTSRRLLRPAVAGITGQ